MTKPNKALKGIKPYPKQQEFFESHARRIAYGGARGGGKSWAMRTKFVFLALKYDGIQILLLRRTFPELRENHIIPLRKELSGVAVYKESTKEFIFSNSSRIKLGYCQNESDVLQYQGQAYEVIGMEEATQFTEFQYTALTECNRLSGNMQKDFVPRMYFTCNPGGVGHGWVKRLFIDRDYRGGEASEDYVFIPSNVYDNQYLMEKNPEYIRNLESLPEIRRKAMLYGDWDAFEGQYFTEFSREKHVIKPFEIPSEWHRFAAFDYGLDMCACLWFAYPPRGERIVVYRELYEPSLLLSQAAEKIKALSGNEKLRYIAAPPDLAGRRQESGKSGFDILRFYGLSGLIAADNRRIEGWRLVREYLTAQKGEEPALGFFACCTNIIRTLPRLIFDKSAVEDAATYPHEITHAPDALRYGLMSLGKNLFLPQSDKERPTFREKRYIDFLSDST